MGSPWTPGASCNHSETEWNLVELPQGLSMEEAAMCEPAAVAAHALRRAGVNLGDTVLVLGAGPIGIMVAQWARAWGATHVMLVDIDPEKLRAAKGMGFGHLLDPTAGDVAEWVHKKTGRGADVVVEASGSPAAFELAPHAARPFAQVVLLGNPAGAMALTQQAYWAILRKELRLLGSWNSSYSQLANEWRLALEAMASGTLRLAELVTHRTNLSRLPERLHMLRERGEFANKVMLVRDNGNG